MYPWVVAVLVVLGIAPLFEAFPAMRPRDQNLAITTTFILPLVGGVMMFMEFLTLVACLLYGEKDYSLHFSDFDCPGISKY